MNCPVAGFRARQEQLINGLGPLCTWQFRQGMDGIKNTFWNLSFYQQYVPFNEVPQAFLQVDINLSSFFFIVNILTLSIMSRPLNTESA